MGRDIQITVDDDIARVSYRGEVDYAATTDMLRTVAALAAEKGLKRLLFDIRNAQYHYYHLGAVRHAEEGPSLGIDHSFRIVFLGAPTESMLGYVEAVTKNRGYWAKAFTDEQEALAWLRAND